MRKITLFLSIFISIVAFAQEDIFVYLTTSTIQSMHKGGPDADYSVSETNSYNMLDGYVKSVNPNFNILCVDTITDLAGNLHYRYALMYDKFIVEDCRFTVHSDGNHITSLSGITLFSDTIETKARISLSNAIKAAKNALAAKNHTWNNDSMNTVKENLVIYYEPLKTPELAYKIQCSNIGHYFSYTVYVSAYTGKVLKMRNNIYSAVNNARIYNTKTQNYDVVTITTKLENGRYILRDEERNIVTYDTENFCPDLNGINNVRYPQNNYIDYDDMWLSSEFPERLYESPNSGLAAHWSAEQTYDFFKMKFNRNGFDNLNNKISIYNNFGGVMGNGAKFEEPNSILIGSGILHIEFFDGTDSIIIIDTTEHQSHLDVIAHEFGHGVSKHTAGFIYEGESGAMSEGYSDIWAACVERYVGNMSDSAIWIWGDKFRTTTPIRNHINPKSTNQPDTYLGMNWVFPTKPDGTQSSQSEIVHVNSSILSHWFYLLVNGGSGVNDNNVSYNVEGVGFDTAMRIAYNALITEMNEHTNFVHARKATLRSAATLYKHDPQVYMSVRNAWYAVGVDAVSLPTEIIGDYGMCENGIYYLDDLPHNAQVIWTSDKFIDETFNGAVQKNKLIFVSGQGSPVVTVQKEHRFLQDMARSYRYVGPATITISAVIGSQTTTLTKNVFANYPIIDIDYEKLTISGRPVHKFSVDDKILPDSLYWEVTMPNGQIVYKNNVNSISVPLSPTVMGRIYATVRDNAGCELCNSASRFVILTSGIIVPQMIHTNPVGQNEILDVLINDNLEESDDYNINSQKIRDYKIEVISEQFGVVRSYTTTDKNVQISMSGLLPGVYFIRLSSDNEILTTSVLFVE